MYTIDLDKFKDAPPCRFHYQAGEAYCALGKLMASCGLELPIPFGDGIHETPPATKTFLEGIGHKVTNKSWMTEVMTINDSWEGTLKDNHEKAFRLAVNTAIDSGLVTIKKQVEVTV
jgi:hypothetical protein